MIPTIAARGPRRCRRDRQRQGATCRAARSSSFRKAPAGHPARSCCTSRRGLSVRGMRAHLRSDRAQFRSVLAATSGAAPARYRDRGNSDPDTAGPSPRGMSGPHAGRDRAGDCTAGRGRPSLKPPAIMCRCRLRRRPERLEPPRPCAVRCRGNRVAPAPRPTTARIRLGAGLTVALSNETDLVVDRQTAGILHVAAWSTIDQRPHLVGGCRSSATLGASPRDTPWWLVRAPADSRIVSARFFAVYSRNAMPGRRRHGRGRAPRPGRSRRAAMHERVDAERTMRADQRRSVPARRIRSPAAPDQRSVTEHQSFSFAARNDPMLKVLWVGGVLTIALQWRSAWPRNPCRVICAYPAVSRFVSAFI